jgi:hypothetical protein
LCTRPRFNGWLVAKCDEFGFVPIVVEELSAVEVKHIINM